MPEVSPNRENDRLSDEAADWCMRMHSDECGEDDRAAFRQWYAADPANAAEYDAMLEIWRMTPSIPAQGATLSTPKQSRAKPKRANWRRLATAAGLCAVAVGLGWAWGWSNGMLPGRIAWYGSAGSHRMVTLPDQSRVDLNVHTTLFYAGFRDRRSVRLSDGEAWFEVNHDSLPFTVQTGTGMVEVTGTSFNVWNDPNGLTVALATGEVVVSPGSLSSVHLTPGMQAAFDRKNGDVKISTADLATLAAWRDGKLILNDLTLEAALPRINRYLAKPLRLGDAKASALRIGGIHDIAELERLPDSLVKALPLRAVRTDGEIVLYSR
jgi:transmembrane sensor